MNASRKFGLKVLVVAVIFWFFKSWYFGWPATLPETLPEAICDGIVFMLCGYSMSFTGKSNERLTNDETLI